MLQFMDRRRKKTGLTTGWLGRIGAVQTEEEICWEEWVLDVSVARPRSETGSAGMNRVYHNALTCKQTGSRRIVPWRGR